MALDGVNLHTFIFTKLVEKQFDDFVPPQLSDILNKPVKGVRVHHDPTLDIDVGTDDFEEAGLNPVGKWLVERIHQLTPMSDPNVRYRSIADAQDEMQAEFGKRMIREVDWKDPTSDDALVRLVTQGLGAHTLSRGDTPKTWVSDLSYVLDFRVRRGFLRYGAKLVIEEDGHGKLVPRSISWARGTSEAGDASWEKAKLAYRVTLAFVATVRDHAVGCHFLPANSLVIATRTQLDITHPIRRLLRAFQFRTPAINAGALVTLIPPRAIFSRLFALEWPELVRFYAHAKSYWRWRTPLEEVELTGTRALGRHHPYSEDALDLYRHEHRFVTEYLDAIQMRERPSDDPALAAFHRELVRVLPKTAGVPPIDTREQLADLLSVAMWTGTGWHEQAGGAIADYLSRPDFVVPAMRDAEVFEDMLPSKQTMVQGVMLGILTNFNMPEIDSNLCAFVPKEAHPAVIRWLDQLTVLKRTIDERNRSRQQPMHTFDPANVEISVSI